MKSSEYPRYWDETIETMPREQIRKLQEEKLRVAVKRAYQTPFYQKKFAEVGAIPDDIKTIEDLHKLPFTTKDDLRKSQAEHPPFGDYTTVPMEQISGVYASSGSTGDPTASLLTPKDQEVWAERGARFFWAFGVRPYDVAQNMYNFQLFAGAWMIQWSMHRVGCSVITTGIGNSEKQLEIMKRFGTTFTGMTPSYAFRLAKVAEELGIDIKKELKLKKMIISGEPGASVPEIRKRIEDVWGAKVYDYPGMQEANGWSGSCEEQSGTHIAEDHFIWEVIDPETKKPVGPGERGVAVVTHLETYAQPLIRWWTDDYVIYTEDYCPCGRTWHLLPYGILGRADDMLKVSGVRVWPSGIEALLKETPGFGGEFRILKDDDTVIEETGGLKKLKLQVEYEQGINSEQLKLEVERRVKERFNITPIVELVTEGTLPRFEHKTSRIVDLRSRK